VKIYAVKDRLIDFYQQPWVAPGDKEAMTAIAAAVNNQENMSAIAQAPHHFELWRLGEVDDEGHIAASKEFLGDCSGFVRGNIRPNSGPHKGARATEASDGAPGALEGGASADERLAEVTARANGISPETTRKPPPGVPRGAGYAPDGDTQ